MESNSFCVYKRQSFFLKDVSKFAESGPAPSSPHCPTISLFFYSLASVVCKLDRLASKLDAKHVPFSCQTDLSTVCSESSCFRFVVEVVL